MITIIADDFTGANDTGMQFISGHGDPVVVIHPLTAFKKTHLSAPVLIVDTESRHLGAQDAYDRIKSTVRLLGERNNDIVFKKIDSTLRGNIGSEIDALMDASGYSHAFVISAAPENGRTVKDGICFIHDTELHKSEFGCDPFSPVDISFVPGIISRQTGRKVGLISYRSIQGPEGTLIQDIDQEISKGSRILVFDTLAQADIEKVAGVIKDSGRRALFVGSSGLAKALSGGRPDTRKPVLFPQRMLFVVGSLKRISHEQVDFMLTDSDRAKAVDLCADTVLSNMEEAIREIIAEVRMVDRSRHIVLRVVPGTGTGEKGCRQGGQSAVSDLGAIIAECLGDITRRILTEFHVDTMFVTGGDTAFNIVKKLNTESIELKAEILPYIPLCKMNSPDFAHPLYMMTKAGGFGDKDILRRILDSMKNREDGAEGDSHEARVFS